MCLFSTLTHLSSYAMDVQQDHTQVLIFQFRVLIIGRANVGKTSILQAVCKTTESLEIYQLDEGGLTTRYVLVLRETLDLIICSGYTQSYNRGWTSSFSLVMADNKDPVCMFTAWQS